MQFRRMAAATLCGALALTVPALTPRASAQQPMQQAVQQAAGHDDTLRTDGNGQSYYVDPVPEAPSTPPAPQRSEGATREASMVVPTRNSRPTSTHTIYLDFDGVTLPASSAWSPDIAAGTYSGFNREGTADFNAAELTQIDRIWRFMAEKFSPFDVNVTTVNPGQAALTRTDAADDAYGVQVVITDDPSPVAQICGSCGGVAYNGLFDGVNNDGDRFDSTDYTIAWVFSSQTFDVAQITALSAAHEVGHTLGLAHDGGPSGAAYYSGHAHWVPVMGISNNSAVSQFSRGEYSGANNTQDDLALIGRNGPSGAAGSFLLPDDAATTGSPPTPLGDHPSYDVDGIISSAADDDLFSIDRTCTDALTATATGVGAGQTVDLKVQILDSANAVLASNDPASGQTFVGDTFTPTGVDATATLASTTSGTTYRIRVDGVGSGNPLNSGYSSYGSIGQYQLTISGCASSGATVPDAPASASATPNPRTTTGTVRWTAPPSNGGSAILGYRITGLPGGTVNVGNVLSHAATGLVPGTTYPVAVFARNAIGLSSAAAMTTLKVDIWAPAPSAPSAPRIGRATSGKVGGAKNATIRWSAPLRTGGAAITTYRVRAQRIVGGKVVRTYTSRALSRSVRALTYGLPAGTYRFRVIAFNSVGASPTSAASAAVKSR